jgi:aspartate/methionine/tyrosine aminotransferase
MTARHATAARTDRLTNWRDKLHDPLARLSEGLPDLLLTGGGEWSTDIAMPPHLIDAAMTAIQGRPQYTSEFGLLSLREAVARKLYEENGIRVSADEVLLTGGATEAISSVLLALVDADDEVIIGDPAYVPIYQPNVLLAGGRMVTVNVAADVNFRIDPAAIEEVITPRSKLIVVTSPENPTGAVLDREALERIAAIAERNDLLIVSDEIYEKFVYDGREHVSTASLPSAAPRTVTVNGFSKTYGLTGYRIGYLAGPRRLVREIAKVRAALSLCASEVSQRVALAALEGPQGWLRPILEGYAQSRDILVDGISRIEGVTVPSPDGAIYVLPDVSAFGRSSFDMTTYILENARVANRPGSYFGAAGEGRVRFNIPAHPDVARQVVGRLEESLSRLAHADPE